MKTYKIKIIPLEIEVEVEEGTTLLETQIKAGLEPDAPCGGKGTCGKCLVEIIEGETSRIEKSCQIKVYKDMLIRVKEKSGSHKLLMKGTKGEIPLNPSIKRTNVEVKKPNLEHINSEWDRIREALAKELVVDEKSISMTPDMFEKVYDHLTKNKYSLKSIMYDNEIVDVYDEERKICAVAVDIGTTSVVAYLLDIENGKELAVASTLNPQSQYGADVIQRLNYAVENGVDVLTSAIQKALNNLIKEIVEKAKITREDIYLVSLVGNTCMHHLFLGVPPESLAKSPYNPMIDDSLVLCAKDYGLNINPKGKAILLPNIAGFVGADTMGVLLSTNFDQVEKLSLIIDIGTNGEMVMGNKDHMIACSTAAGPAFEGAKITCGMRGKEGAIERARFESGSLIYEVIGDVEPAGICGSGLLDIVAALIEEGVIDETGKFDEANPAVKDKIIEIDGKKSFSISKKVYLTQGDVREVQLAKAAIAAGIELMMEALNIKTKDILQVMIAGAFGNYMDPHSACVIKMIPPELEDRIIPIGNAAGEGAKIAALNSVEFYKSDSIAEKIQFLELAINPNFQDSFVDNLSF